MVALWSAIPFTDEQRMRLAVKDKGPGRRLLEPPEDLVHDFMVV